MPIISRGTELGTIAEVVPGAIQSGPVTGLAPVIVNPTIPAVADKDDGSIGATFDGGGFVIEVNSTGTVRAKSSGTIVKWTIALKEGQNADSAQFDVWRTTFANFQAGLISAVNSICGGNYPSLVSQRCAEDGTLTGWNTLVSAGDMFVFICRSRTTPIWVEIQLDVDKS